MWRLADWNVSERKMINFQDLVVGAPYDGPDGRGAIYIFLGTTEGISKQPAQVLFFCTNL
jgi:hypothetical protein